MNYLRLKYLLIPLGIIALLSGCHSNLHYLPDSYKECSIPSAPDYSQESSWAALPTKVDRADEVPETSFYNGQDSALIDVFFIHPTTFLKKSESWNASIDNEKINRETDLYPIRHQGSVFNQTCRVYAPRYRQAHIKAYLHLEEGGLEALSLAYHDVKTAFLYYLEEYNQGRPFIIASHSQGTSHSIRLIRELIDEKPLSDQLVAAYMAGMPVKQNEFENIRPCNEPEETGCYVCWMTFGDQFFPKFYDSNYPLNAVHNPINFSMDSTFNSQNEHKGIVMRKFKLKYPSTISGRAKHGMLWIKKPDVPVLKWFIRNRNWHAADYNLFWVNIRENVQTRSESFLKTR